MKQWEAVGFPLCLTSLMYMGWFILKCYQFGAHGPNMGIVRWICHFMDISVWRMYIVAPFTEELVFRACMISLLLCGGFKPYTVILLSPVLFSLAHLNHLLEFYIQQNSSLLKASMVVGHIAAPLVSHMFCKIMGLPAFFSPRTCNKTHTHEHNHLLVFYGLIFYIFDNLFEWKYQGW
ncbi:CAAX prenyl protease 2 [Helianthus annuus]|uniref:CAAX prenyl protease 2 n=1 Tax=Helianthus annuus TaxID=4232 RepID=UPI00165309F4|nr:CAAX prenyl protease 2 [Helianthus annuus]